ncbi:MAG: VWA domain-containing protein [Acidobacteria bacterium]|nr:VWA domain-containing protein [Acidobacteriota bacterium]
MRVPALALGILLSIAPPTRADRQRAGSIDAFIVLDESGSMKPIFQKVLAYVSEELVVGYLQPGDYFCLVGFSDVPHVRISQQVSSRAEKENLAAIVRNLNVVPAGYTDMGRALEETLRQVTTLADSSHQQAVLIITDGMNQPPRESPYFSPMRSDTGRGLAPPSGFNPAFLAQVKKLSEAGWRTHVVGIGSETDAKTLAEALGSAWTVLRQFDAAELQAGLGNFWDETLNLASLEMPQRPYLPGETISGHVFISSASDHEREVHLSGVKSVKLERVGNGSLPGISFSLAESNWQIPARKKAAFEIRASLPPDFPPGDYSATVRFEQTSAVRFYPPEATIAFHVPGFWELHGTTIVVSSTALLILAISLLLYRRRPVAMMVIVDGAEGAHASRPARLGVAGACSVGGGATDRMRIPGLPQKVAMFERRTVNRFALLSTSATHIPTIPEYALGDPIEVRVGPGESDRRLVRIVRWTRPATAGKRPATPRSPVVPPPASGGVDFR